MQKYPTEGYDDIVEASAYQLDRRLSIIGRSTLPHQQKEEIAIRAELASRLPRCSSCGSRCGTHHSLCFKCASGDHHEDTPSLDPNGPWGAP